MSTDALKHARRAAFHRRLDELHLAPLWNVLSDLVTAEPRSGCRPFGWRFDDIRAAMEEAGALVSLEDVERRVLILENPGLRGQSRITTSLYAGVQLVLPGEIAPSHRHTQCALRFVLEGSGAHTTVDGEKTIMEVGDFVITPPGAWHDHGNETERPMYWLDGLDIPLITFLDASFSERMERTAQQVTRAPGQSHAEYGHNMVPVDDDRRDHVSPIFNYPYVRSREALQASRRARPADPCHGWKLRYANPLNGQDAMPTIGASLQLLPRGETAPFRCTAGTVFVCTEGRGRTRIGSATIEWGPRDIVVAPSWMPVLHEVDDEAVLFSFSDRPVQDKLGLYREARGVPGEPAGGTP